MAGFSVILLLSLGSFSLWRKSQPTQLEVVPYEGPSWCVVEVKTKPTNPKFSTHFTLKSEAEPGEPLVLFTESTLVDEILLQIPMCEDTNLD